MTGSTPVVKPSAHGLVTDAGAHWLGAAVIVDALTDPRLRRDLGVRALIQGRELDALP
jgi:adenine phosphoribosyltransferase